MHSNGSRVGFFFTSVGRWAGIVALGLAVFLAVQPDPGGLFWMAGVGVLAFAWAIVGAIGVIAAALLSVGHFASKRATPSTGPVEPRGLTLVKVLAWTLGGAHFLLGLNIIANASSWPSARREVAILLGVVLLCVGSAYCLVGYGLPRHRRWVARMGFVDSALLSAWWLGVIVSSLMHDQSMNVLLAIAFCICMLAPHSVIAIWTWRRRNGIRVVTDAA